MKGTQTWQQLPWWYWDEEEQEWSQNSTHKYEAYKDDLNNNELDQLTLLTFNVLHDEWHREHKLCAPRRFRKTIDMLRDRHADLIGLNEVTTQFQQLLLKEEWVRERYFVSDATEEGETLRRPSGNLLLSRFPFHSLYTTSMSGCTRKAIIAAIDLNVGGVIKRTCICSAHPTALSWNVAKRKKQIGELQKCIEEELPLRFEDIVIMGDFNFHLPEEDASVPEGYTDLWPAVRSDPGYTFDADKNPMLAETWPLSFENRRMRLDRIILKCNHSRSKDKEEEEEEEKEVEWIPDSMRFFAHTLVAAPDSDDQELANGERLALDFEEKLAARRPKTVLGKCAAWMYGWMLAFPFNLCKAILATIFDLFGVNLFRTVDDYLFPSDHFGLIAVLKVKPDPSSHGGCIYSKYSKFM